MPNVAVSAVKLASGFGPSKDEMVEAKDVPGEETDAAVTTVKRTMVDTAALAAVGSGIATLVLTEGTLVTTAAYATGIFGPVAAFQKRKLVKLGGFRGQHNKLRSEVNELSEENDKLTENVDKLEVAVDKLEQVEGELSEIAGDASNANRLVACVKKNKELLAKIKENLESRVIHDIMTVLMRADRNQDFTIGTNEMNMIIFSLGNIEGIDFNEKLFRKLLAEHGGKVEDGTMRIDGAMTIIRNLLDDDVPEEYNVFNIRPEQLKK